MRAQPKVMLLVAVAAVRVTAQTSSWELSDPTARMLMGIDIKSLRESEVGRSIREQMNKVPPPGSGAQSAFQGPMQAMALGFLDQIDRVYASSKPNPPAMGAAPAKHNPPFVLIVEGRFPAEELQPFLKGKAARRYRDADLYRMSQTDATTFAFIKGAADSSTLLLGDEKSVLAAIGRRGGALVPASALLKRAQTLAATNDFWLIADGPLSGFQPTSAAAGNAMASKLAGQVKGLDIGLALRDGFHLDLGVAAESEAVAAQLTQLLSMQIQTALAAQPKQPGMEELARKLQIASEGNRMQLSLALTKDEFAQQVRAAQEARLQAAATAPSQPPQQAVRQPKPANSGQITIYGLEGGPRVIQTTH